jgi:hypothetical protein
MVVRFKEMPSTDEGVCVGGWGWGLGGWGDRHYQYLPTPALALTCLWGAATRRGRWGRWGRWRRKQGGRGHVPRSSLLPCPVVPTCS